MTAPLNWPQLVAEALRRRKAEGLTQQAHADLAGVSKPVIIAFDRGETTLSLGRALSILKVVGLVEEGPPPGSHAAFVAAAQARWRELIADLPADDPARHPLGGYEVDYEIRGVSQPLSATKLLPHLRVIAPNIDLKRLQLDWRPYWMPSSENLRPYIREDDVIECRIADNPISQRRSSPTDFEFWRISPSGHTFLKRGLEEDDTSIRNPGSYLDVIRPIHLMIAVLLHAAELAHILREQDGPILFNTRYHGLSKRRLVSFADPGDMSFSGIGQSLSDRVHLSIETTGDEIRRGLPALVHRFLAPLYARFGGFQLERTLVEQEMSRLIPQAYGRQG